MIQDLSLARIYLNENQEHQMRILIFRTQSRIPFFNDRNSKNMLPTEES